MRFAVRCGDTWPHDGTVEMDWWPQGTHLVGDSSRLVLCASGDGGGSQQAMFRADLDPLLERAYRRWQTQHAASTPAADEIDRLFAAVQREFQELHDPPWAEQLQASAVALLLGSADCAIANVGMDRAWMLRQGRLERISKDCSLASMAGARSDDLDVPEFMRELPAALFGRVDAAAANWQTRKVAVREGDFLVLASGFRNIGVTESDIESALKPIIAEMEGEAFCAGAEWHQSQFDVAAQRLVQRLAEVAAREEDVDRRKKARWHFHSRLALALVRIVAA